MENVTRKNGFIDINDLAKDVSFRNILWKENYSMLEEYGHSNIKYIFNYKNEIFIYKIPGSINSCYLELIAEELAHDFSIPSAHYDLAYTKEYGKGVISKNFKQENHTYIKGISILTDYIKNCLFQDKYFTNTALEREIEKYNSLEGIWAALEYRYLKHPNRIEIVNKLINQLVDIFIFDLLTGQTDRHEENWGIVENEDDIYLQPLFDNERLLFMDNDFRFAPHSDSQIDAYTEFKDGIKKLLLDFITVSSPEFIERLKEKIPLISKENIEIILLKIEKRTNALVPPKIKEQIYANFKTMETIINTTLSLYEEKRKMQ